MVYVGYHNTYSYILDLFFSLHKAIYRLDIASGNPIFNKYYLTQDIHCTNKLVSVMYIL